MSNPPVRGVSGRRYFADMKIINADSGRFAMKSYSGNEIFRDAIAYKVIDEKIEPQTAFQDIYKVTEVYGYAPNETFSTYSGEVVQFPTLRDTSADGKVVKTVTFYYGLGKIYFDDNDGNFNVGDWLDFLVQASGNLYTCYGMQLSQVSEVRTEGGKRTCYCTDISWNVPSSGSTQGSQAVIEQYGSRSGTATRTFTVREQGNQQVSTTNFISYHTSFPNIDDRLKIMAGNNESQEINSATTPSYTQWQTWKNNGTLVCLLEPEITQVGTLYKKTVKKCRAR